MRFINLILVGINSIFFPTQTKVNVIEKYPSTFNKNDVEVLREDWVKVGEALRKAIYEYKK